MHPVCDSVYESLMLSISDNVEQSHLHLYGQSGQTFYFLFLSSIFSSVWFIPRGKHTSGLNETKTFLAFVVWICVFTKMPCLLSPCFAFSHCAGFSCMAERGWRSRCSSLCGCLTGLLTSSDLLSSGQTAGPTGSREKAQRSGETLRERASLCIHNMILCFLFPFSHHCYMCIVCISAMYTI